MSWSLRQTQCGSYYVSAEYQRLGDRTKYVRRGILDRICEKNGSKPYALMEPRHVRRMRDEMADRPEAANGFVKALRQVYGFAVEYELAQRNPARDVPYLKARGDGFHSCRWRRSAGSRSITWSAASHGWRSH